MGVCVCLVCVCLVCTITTAESGGQRLEGMDILEFETEPVFSGNAIGLLNS